MRSPRRGSGPGLAGLGLGLGSLGVGVVGLVWPGLVGRLMRVDRSTVWVIALRDLASAWLILRWGGAPAYVTRAMFDLGDAGMMMRRRPGAAVLAMAAAVLGMREAFAVRD